MKIITGHVSSLGLKIAQSLDTPVLDAVLSIFHAQEIFVHLEQSLENQTVAVIHSTAAPVHDRLMEFLLILNYLKQHNAKKIIAVVPYFGYGRQNAMLSEASGASSPVSFITGLLKHAGADHLIVMDIHSPPIDNTQGMMIEYLTPTSVFAQDIENRFCGDYVLVSPDYGARHRVALLAQSLKKPFIVLDKRSAQPLSGQDRALVEGKICIVIDDIIDSGHTLCNAAVALADANAYEVHGYVTHGVFSSAAIQHLNTPLRTLTISDSIQRCETMNWEKLRFLSLAPLFATAIMKIGQDQ